MHRRTPAGLGCAGLVLLAGLTLRLEATGDPATDVFRDNEHRYTLTLASGWRAHPVPAGSRTPLASFEHRPSGTLLAVSRVDYPNPEAWREKTLPAYASQVEEGLRNAFTTYRRVDFRIHKLDIVPALDLAFQYRKPDQRDEIVFMRLLFFRRYTLLAAMAAPATTSRSQKARHRAVLDSFAPYLGN